MRRLSMTRPKVSQVSKWTIIHEFHRESDWRGRPDGDAIVYSADNFYDYYKVVADGKTKYFFGEVAWHDWKRHLGDLGYSDAAWVH